MLHVAISIGKISIFESILYFSSRNPKEFGENCRVFLTKTPETIVVCYFFINLSRREIEIKIDLRNEKTNFYHQSKNFKSPFQINVKKLNI